MEVSDGGGETLPSPSACLCSPCAGRRSPPPIRQSLQNHSAALDGGDQLAKAKRSSSRSALPQGPSEAQEHCRRRWSATHA
eukprot:scaffold25855_cov82-Phaeocystis_antarctica.AAC.2